MGRSGSSGACSMCLAYCIFSMFLCSKRFRNTGSCRKQSVNAVNTNIFDVDRLKKAVSFVRVYHQPRRFLWWTFIVGPDG